MRMLAHKVFNPLHHSPRFCTVAVLPASNNVDIILAFDPVLPSMTTRSVSTTRRTVIPRLSLCAVIGVATFLIMATANPAVAKQAITPVPQVVQAAVSEMLVMFQNRDVKEQSTIIRERYDPKAFFMDPLMKVRGHKDIALEFYGLIKAFSAVKLDQKSLTVTEGSRPDVYEAQVENTQHYVTERTSWLSKKLMPEKVDIEATTTLEVQKDSGKILSHVEVWHNKSTFIPGFVKPFIGTSSATLFKILGWGKDVDAKEAAATSTQ